jgi:hypothetical protein
MTKTTFNGGKHDNRSKKTTTTAIVYFSEIAPLVKLFR